MSEISSKGKKLLEIYEVLYGTFGPRHWWPGDSPFEVIVGAILTQNTAWVNVSRAISQLKGKNLMTPQAIYKLDEHLLTDLIRPAGYYNLKASRLRNFMGFLFKQYSGDLEKMFSEKMDILREKLLAVKGIGRETADSILLYAGGFPSFVVDAYTKRILSRHLMVSEDADYEEIRSLFMDNLPNDTRLFNEYHALLVHLGKTFCKKNPRCEECPIKGL